MKGLMAKLKGMPFKDILLVHAEKFVLGFVGLFVLLALMRTTWAGIDKKPDELLNAATTAGTKLNTGEWPVEKQADFKPSTYQATANSMFTEINVAGQMSAFAYDKPMTFELYKREEPRDMVVFPPPQDMLADAGHMVIGINAPLEATMEGAEEDQSGLGGPRPPAGGPMAPAGGPMPPAGGPMAPVGPMGAMAVPGMSGMVSGTSGLQPRGQRFVALRGTVNLFEVGKKIKEALHLDSIGEAMGMIEVIDFQIERQKAVAGPNPWPDDTWQPVSLDRADEVLAETNLAADIVDSRCTNPVFTMPLPARLDGDYTKIVSHPALDGFVLSKEQREMEQKLNSAFMESASEMGITEKQTKRRGFLGTQVDINGIRNDVMSAPGANMNDIFKRAGVNPMPGGAGYGTAPAMPPGYGAPAGGNAMPPGYGSAPPNANYAGGRGGLGSMPPGAGGKMPPNMMPPGMALPGGGMGQQAGMGTLGANAAGTLVLFRYLDFDVNPGEAYRYRVKLEFANPNYGAEPSMIREAKVAEDETLFSDWSEPSAPVVVKPDTNVFLADVDKRSKTRGEARVQVYQWDPSLGTYIDSKLVVKFGQFVGGLAESAWLDLGKPSLDDKTALFATKDFLLDTNLPPTLLPADNPDLNLPRDAKTTKDGIELPQEALVLDEYGNPKVLDNIAERPMAQEADKKVKEERKPWEYLREQAQETNPLDALGGPMGPMGPMGGMMPGMMMSSPTSSLKRGKSGKGGAAGGMPMPGAMPGYPAPGNTKNKKGAASSYPSAITPPANSKNR